MPANIEELRELVLELQGSLVKEHEAMALEVAKREKEGIVILDLRGQLTLGEEVMRCNTSSNTGR